MLKLNRTILLYSIAMSALWGIFLLTIFDYSEIGYKLSFVMSVGGMVVLLYNYARFCQKIMTGEVKLDVYGLTNSLPTR